MGDQNRITIFKEIHFPHSLGLLYSAFTYFTGFRVNSGEYKIMGLAPYGEPRFSKTILDNLIDLKDDGSFRLNQRYFDYCTGLKMTNELFAELFGVPARGPEDRLEQVHMDLAASIQSVTEEAIIRLARSLASETGARKLCLAGGVALNCVANGKVLRDIVSTMCGCSLRRATLGVPLGRLLLLITLSLIDRAPSQMRSMAWPGAISVLPTTTTRLVSG
jgi:carbamoyltransferase